MTKKYVIFLIVASMVCGIGIQQWTFESAEAQTSCIEVHIVSCTGNGCTPSGACTSLGPGFVLDAASVTVTGYQPGGYAGFEEVNSGLCWGPS